MAARDLEFRGISRNYLGMYFEELGAKRITDSLPITYQADGWCGQILKEEELSFTAIFKVNSIMVRFLAEEEDVLNELIKNYRYKTTRIGG